jgi:sugar phosphate permease
MVWWPFATKPERAATLEVTDLHSVAPPLYSTVSPWFELSLALMGIVGIVHVTSHALAQTVIQTYSPSEFRGRTMAIFHMTHVVLLTGGIAIGALSSLVDAPWAAASMSIAGTLSMIAIYLALPRARLIR